jgi:multidrug efflux pump subunit AcrA (membrane-fusion protein)
MVPRTAIVIDIYGGEWVYVQSAPQAYERRRIEVAAIRGTYAMLARGLKPGDKIVTAGAAELFGSEFGAK